MKDKTLLQLSSIGIIPGPNESEDAFEKRTTYLQQLHNLFLYNGNPVSTQQELLKTIEQPLNELLGAYPTWIPILFSNQNLAPWHGGCCWIFQETKQMPKGAFFQLRKKLKDKKKLFGTTREEILLHETVHALRMNFDEPKYEEILAYKTSPKPWKQTWGALFGSTLEVLFFMTLLLLPYLFFFLIPEKPLYILSSLLLPPLAFAAFAYRLHRKQHTLNKTFSFLLELTRSPSIAHHVLFRLTDQEIDQFATGTSEDLFLYIKHQQDKSLRHKLLYVLVQTCLAEELHSPYSS